MGKFDNRLYVQICEKYNEVFAEACQNQMHDDALMKDSIADSEVFLNDVHNSIQNWSNLPLSVENVDFTAASVIDQITSIDDAIVLAEYAAAICDDAIPDIIKIKLNTFGVNPSQVIMKRILDRNWRLRESDETQQDSDHVIVASFIRLLGEWEWQEGIQPLVKNFVRNQSPSELIADAMRDYLLSMDEAPVMDIIAALNESIQDKNDLPAACEYLMIFLTDIGKRYPQEEIFICLKNCFRHMTSKAIGAICLGDYGDGRAIPTLRGWLDKNPKIDDRQILYEAISAIQRLGGDVSDLKSRLINNRAL
jgi:hypothetical protein